MAFLFHSPLILTLVLSIIVVPSGFFSPKYFDFGVKVCPLCFKWIGQQAKLQKCPNATILDWFPFSARLFNVATTRHPPYASIPETFICVPCKCLLFVCVSAWEVCVSAGVWAFLVGCLRQWVAALSDTERPWQWLSGTPWSLQLSISCQCWLRGSVPLVACRGPHCTMTEVRRVRHWVGAVFRAVTLCVWLLASLVKGHIYEFSVRVDCVGMSISYHETMFWYCMIFTNPIQQKHSIPYFFFMI